jgi:hypothetical protein
MSKRRRTNPNNKFVMLERWFWRCPAWQALPHAARSLYIELEMRFTGQNNGDIELSVRRAMELIGCSYNYTSKMFGQLEDKGFIKARQRGSFSWKARHSTMWILTLHEYLGREPTKDFMKWQPPKQNTGSPKKQKPDSPQESDGLSARVRGASNCSVTDSPQESEKAKIAPPSDSPQESVLIYQGIDPEKSEPLSETPSLAREHKHNNVVSFAGRKQLADIKLTYGGKPTLLSRVLDVLHAEGPVRRRTIIDRLGVREEEVQRAVITLCERGHAERVGHGLYDLTPVARSQRWA